VAQERLGVGILAAEGAVDLCWGRAAPESKDSVTKTTTNLTHPLFIVQPNLLKCREGVCREYLCPLVRVVAGRVATREDVAKG